MCRRLPLLVLLVALARGAPASWAQETGPNPAQDLQDALDLEEELVETCADIRRLTVAVWNKRYPRQDGKIVENSTPSPVGFGSGVIVERKSRYWVITNVHVIQGADVVSVTAADGRDRDVEVHDTIPQYDIALLSFAKKPRELKAYPLSPAKARISKSLEEGAWVVATGNPFGLALDGQAVTTLGVLSGRDRILGGQFFYGSALQHDAEVNPGNSGGPLWNRKGELIGINGKIATRPRAKGEGPANTGASFSIPLHQVDAFLMALIETRTDASAGWLGLDFETSMDERGNPRGAAVVKVEEASPAGGSSKNGLQRGDVVVTIWGFGEDHRIRTASDVTNLMALCREGSYLKIKYKRGKRYYEWSGRLPATPARPNRPQGRK